MPEISPTLPATGDSRGSEEQDMASALATIVSLLNGNLDSSNLAANSVGDSELAAGAVTAAKIGTVPFARVRRDTNQSIPSGVLTPVTFTIEEHDTNAMFSTGDGTRVYTPTAGYYAVSATFSAATTTTFAGIISRHTTADALTSPNVASVGGLGNVFNLHGFDYFGGNERAKLQVFHSAGAAINVTGYMTLAWVGPT